ncbi:MAG: class I SAM-dependent methyltransferase [Chrysiogenales bacterium]
MRRRAKALVKGLLETIGVDISRYQAKATLKRAEELLASLHPPFRSALLSMYRGAPQLGDDGQLHAIDESTRISPAQGIWLYDLCLSVRPEATLEIGMAYGYSTLFLLAAIAKNRTGHHTAIDPYQHSDWHGIGCAHANAVALAAGLDAAFLLIEDRSDRVATDLARSKSVFDLIFIDGNHRFDDVLVDFYLYAPLCAIGGHIALDDVLMSSIQTVVAFVRENRTDFVEIHTTEANMCVFQRVGDDSRRHDDFHRFVVARGKTRGR